MVFLDQWRTVSLTPTLSCLASAWSGNDRQALYAAFYGALDLLVRIDKDAARFIRTPPKLEHGKYRFPYISSLRKHDNPNESIQFRICRAPPRHAGLPPTVYCRNRNFRPGEQQENHCEICASVLG